MAGKDFVIDQRLGVVMGTATPVSPADDRTGTLAGAAGGTDLLRGAASPEIGERRSGEIFNFANKNAKAAGVSIEGCVPAPERHLLSCGRPACGSSSAHLTLYPELVSCPACGDLFQGRSC